MLAHRVVEHLDVIEHVLSGLVTRFVSAPPDALTLEEVEEALGHGVIVAVAPPAHGMLKIVGSGEGSPVHASELRALVRVDQHPPLWLAPPDCHVQGLKDDLGRLPALHRPAHHAAGVEVKHDSQIGKTFHGADVGNVCNPGAISLFHVELPVQRVGCNA